MMMLRCQLALSSPSYTRWDDVLARPVNPQASGVTLLADLERAVGAANLIVDPTALRTYEYGWAGELTGRCRWRSCCRPTPRRCGGGGGLRAARGMPFVARGAGTGLSGGAVPVAEGIVIGLARMQTASSRSTCPTGACGAAGRDQPRRLAGRGAARAATTRPTRRASRCARSAATWPRTPAAPTASSTASPPTTCWRSRWCWRTASVTRRDASARSTCWARSSARRGRSASPPRSTVRVLPTPERVETLLADFDSTDSAGEAVSAIIARRHHPGGDRDDGRRSAMRAAEAALERRLAAGCRRPCCWSSWTGRRSRSRSPSSEVAACAARPGRHRAPGGERGAAGRVLAGPQGRLRRRWAGSAPTTTCRTASCRAPGCPRRCADRRASRRHGLRVANVFHAGDGNLHPLVLYDARHGARPAGPSSWPRRSCCCLDAGGSLTGEHGIGLDKARHMPRMFSETDLETMHRLRCGFDPDGLCNPGKVFPTPRLCGEVPGPYREHPLEREPDWPSDGDRARAPATSPARSRRRRRWPSSSRRWAGSGQMLALDPPDDGGLTVGEAFDRALFGPRAHRYGLPRDLILGVRVRLPDGTVARGGGKVVKNVAGYDLPKLLTGAHGRLGELLELTLRLHPLPRDRHRRSRRSRTRAAGAAAAGLCRVHLAARAACWCASRARPPPRWPSRPPAAGGRRRSATTRRCGTPIARARRDSTCTAACRPRRRRTRAPARGRGGYPNHRPLGAGLAVRRRAGDRRCDSPRSSSG